MRLLNVNTLQFKEFSNREIPPYGILSHRWTDDELSYKDSQKGRRTDSLGHQKVLEFCAFVRGREIFQFGPLVNELRERLERIDKGYQSQDGVETEGEALQWIWIDTICIEQLSRTLRGYQLNVQLVCEGAGMLRVHEGRSVSKKCSIGLVLESTRLQ